VNLHKKLSENFRLGELLKSNTATRLGIDNTPTPAALENLTILTMMVLQPIRDEFGVLALSSAYRCLKLNRHLGSQDTSQHLSGQAADLEKPGVDNYVLACWIRDNLDFDQLILEFYDGIDPTSGWIHVSYSGQKNRNECLTIHEGTIKRGLVK